MLLTNQFDHLGIKPLNNVLLEIGPFEIFGLEIGPITIMWYAALILTGALVATILGIIEGKKIGVPREFVEDLALYGIPISIVGARLFYVLFEIDKYIANPLEMFKIYEGGLAIYGAVTFAVIWGYYLCKKRGVSFLKAIDLGAVGFLIAQAIGRWGNFMNQEAHGGLVPGATFDAQREYLQNMGLPNFIVNQMFTVDGSKVGYFHPTFLYESLWNLLGVAFFMLLRRTKWLYIGDLGIMYLIWYGIGRGIIEGMRTDSLYVWNTGIRANQYLSILLVIIGATLLIVRHIKKWEAKYYYEVLEENK